MKKYATHIMVFLSFALNLVTTECSAAKEGWNEGGIRMGIQAGPRREYFHLYELYAVYGLPWEWQPSAGWVISSQLNTSLGALHTAAETGVIGSLGAGLTITKTGLNLVPEAGISLDLLDKRQFGRQDFGSILLWGAYIGLCYRFNNGLGIGYRILHLSNNHILYSKTTPNPGLDLHMIGASWKF
ncbi:MAG: acyloxyacyl hydrolase [Desulfuromonadales bacterium]|nr:acyloxyacyl hydrolase [Desulfuromonadales bacterium]